MIYRCCDMRRRDVLKTLRDETSPPSSPPQGLAAYNGIDFLEVADASDQRTLNVHFIHDLLPGQLSTANVHIEGGERIKNVPVTRAYEAGYTSPVGDAKVLVVEVTNPGDFAIYTLRLIDAQDHTRPPADFDPILSSIEFSFKAGCPSEFDCQPQTACPPRAPEPIDISYLAKDYSSFRQLVLDRMAKTIPQWQERNPADLGIVLAELLAYLGDYLSYEQDAVATEAYLGTARRRTSIRRHVKLVDYPMHDGCNARTWVHFELRADAGKLVLQARGKSINKLLTHIMRPGFGGVNLPSDRVIPLKDPAGLRDALAQSPKVFELVEDARLFPPHNQMSFYTWGNRNCCLPRGATQAWLRGRFDNLQQGMVLILAEAKGPQTGVPADADPQKRCAVRLTNVSYSADPLGGRFDAIPNDAPVAATRIEWAPQDALPFPLCISSIGKYEDVSVAFGNIVLADEGDTISDEELDPVPAANPALTLVAPSTGDFCHPDQLQPSAARYRALLQKGPVVFTDPYDSSLPATLALAKRNLDQLLPDIFLTAQPQQLQPSDDDSTWQPVRDLLKSHPDNKAFVVEVENDFSASLRFGDTKFGARPQAGAVLYATYRIGSNAAGNIGADSLYHLATSEPAIVSDPGLVVSVTNPLPAVGGLDPENLEKVRQMAPDAFRVQQRAVTTDDYGEMAQRCDSTLQRAIGTFRWTGSWHTVFIAADRKGGLSVDDAFREQLKTCMERFRMAGHDLEVDDPHFVSLDVAMDVCVKRGYFAADVERDLLALLGNRVLPDGTLGAFHPDQFTFGQPVYLSQVYARVQSTAGVDSVRITKFQRQGIDSDAALKSGKLEMGRLEIARLDNDANFPEHGRLQLNMLGGR